MSKLFFVALACLVAVVAAADSTNTTLIQLGSYSDSACTTPISQTNFTAGNCLYGSFAMFTDGSYVYTYLYSSGTGCGTANITSISKIQVGICGIADTQGQSFLLYKAYSNVVNPALPTSFPPTGFTTTTQYINTTGASGDNTCSSSVQVISARPTPTTSACYKIYDTYSTQAFLSSSCTTQVVGYYGDATCTNLVRTYTRTVEFKACDNGVKSVCTGSDANLPSLSGSVVGLTQYDNNQCMSNSKTRVQTLIPGACFGGSTVACTTQNSTQYLTAVQYANNNCTGDVKSTTYIGVNTCLISGPVVNATATCDAAPIGPGSGSSTGIVTGSSSTGTSGGNGTSSTGSADGSSGSSSADLTRSVSIGSMVMIMIVGFITIKMNN